MSHKKVHSLVWQFTEKFDYQGEPQEASCTGDEHSLVPEKFSAGYCRGSHFSFSLQITFTAVCSESVFLNALKHLPIFFAPSPVNPHVLYTLNPAGDGFLKYRH